MLGPEVAGRLVEADQRLLLDVVGVAADEEVAPALGPGEAAVAVDQRLEGVAVAVLGERGELDVVVRSVSVRVATAAWVRPAMVRAELVRPSAALAWPDTD